MQRLLVVEDDNAVRTNIVTCLELEGFDVDAVGSTREALAKLQDGTYPIVLSDIYLDERTGLDVLNAARSANPDCAVILMSGRGSMETVMAATRGGAFDYLAKPFDLDDMIEKIRRAEASLTEAQEKEARIDDIPETEMIGSSSHMVEIFKVLAKVAPTDATLLVEGETGTGKELIARLIHRYSLRAEKPFVAVDCGSIPPSLLESELFGALKGSFTGADRDRQGVFESANGGTIFLDEIGDMTPLTQAKVLRLIQDQQFERLGGTETVRTDVRLVAATNADLERMCDDGRFRRDLYFRLNVFAVHLPPLRERGDDVGLLVDHYVRRFGHELGKPAEVAPAAAAALRAYPWPGNVRELQSVLKQSLLRMSGTVLLPDFLPDVVRAPGDAPAKPLADAAFGWDEFVGDRLAGGTLNLYAEALERMEREILMRVLKHTDGNQLQAARVLGITRGSLRNKIRALGISISREVWSDDDHSD